MAVVEMPDLPPLEDLSPIADRKIWTFEDYLKSPQFEGGYEIIDGELIPMASPSWQHQDVVGALYTLFRAFQKSQKTGRALIAPYDVLLSRVPLRTLQPDVLFITNERLEEAGGVPRGGPLEVGPEIVVEALSPSETRTSIMRKLEEYQRVGVKEAWLLGIESETLEVLDLSGAAIQTVAVYVNGQTCVSVAVPGLSVALVDIFG